jgi:hypothetical protein
MLANHAGKPDEFEEPLSALPPMSLPLAPTGVPAPCRVEHVTQRNVT